MRWITTTSLPLALLLACGGPPKTTDSGSSGGSTHDTQGSSSTSSTTSPGTTTDGSGSGTGTASEGTTHTSHTTTTTTTTGSTSSTGPGSTGQTTDQTTGSSSTGDQSTGSSGPGSSTSGGVCSGQGQSCANGELCCANLECCAGVPVPPGKEFCSNMCPISDRNAKTDVRALDPQEVLRKVAELDITTWRYKKDAEEVRHLGPMAQDFHAAFGLWDTDKMIFPLDASGVSMAAIQGLYQRVVAAEAERDELQTRLERLERRLGELEAR